MSEINHRPCPYVDCGSSDAFSFNTDKRTGKCFSCDGSYPQSRLTKRKREVFDWAEEAYPLSRSPYREKHNEDEEDEEYSYMKPTNSVLKVVEGGDYVEHRGIMPKTMEFYDCLTYFEGDVPVKHTYKYPNGTFKSREFPKNFNLSENRQFKSDMLFGMNLFPAGSAQAVTITEGELDAMSAYQMLGSKYPVVSLPGATPPKKLLENCKDWLGSFEKIYLSFDSDDKADKFALSLMHLFPGRVYKVPHDKFKDANEFLQAKQSNLYKSVWFNAKLYTPDNIYTSADDFLELLHDTPDHCYVPTGIHALDDKILGLMQGHFTVIKAPTGIGKSEFMRYLEYNFIANHPHVRFASWHLEETKLRSLLGVVSYYLHDNLTRKDLIQQKDRMADVEDAIKHITSNSGYMQFHLREQDGADELIDQIRILTQVYDCKYILFEPIQDAVTTDEDKKEGVLADLSIRLSKLAADLNVGIVTIAHTNENGDPKYCKMIAQRASVIIDLERDKEADDLLDRNTTRLVVKKNRPCGLEGEAGELVFDGETFTLNEKGSGW